MSSAFLRADGAGTRSPATQARSPLPGPPRPTMKPGGQNAETTGSARPLDQRRHRSHRLNALAFARHHHPLQYSRSG